jgi:ABC-type multidrug transport system ATPase subunit
MGLPGGTTIGFCCSGGMGLDRPDGGQVTIGGRCYGDLRWPLREVGALLEAKAFHPGRTARAHLAALAASNAIGGRRVDEVLAITGLEKAADRRAGKFSLGMAQRLGIASALLGDLESCCWTSRSTAWTPAVRPQRLSGRACCGRC